MLYMTLNTDIPCLLSCYIVDCGPLSNPANGQVDISSGTTLNSVATYSCYTGYNVTGESTRICTADGQWTSSAPTCVGKLCLVIV